MRGIAGVTPSVKAGTEGNSCGGLVCSAILLARVDSKSSPPFFWDFGGLQLAALRVYS